MTTRIEGSGSAPIVSELDGYQELMARMELDVERSNRESMRADRESARAMGEAAAAQKHEAADLRLAAAVVSSCVKIGNAVSTAVGGSSADGINKVVDGLADATNGLLTRFADEADIRADRLDSAADDARSRAEEARADADSAAGTREKLTDLYSQALSERRRAEEAATRA